MTALRRTIDPAAPDSAVISEALRVIRSGGVVAYPTEHYYALGVDPANPTALARLFGLKGRAQHKPVLLAITRRRALSGLTCGVPKGVERVVAHWPDGLTMLLPAADSVLPGVRSDAGMVGIRLLRSGVAAVATALIDGCGHALTATSANRSGEAASGDPAAVAAALPEVDLLLDAGVLPEGPLSTVLDVTGDRPWRVVRAGAVSAERLAAYELSAAERT